MILQQIAVSLLAQQGFKRLGDLRGGLGAWMDEGLSMVST